MLETRSQGISSSYQAPYCYKACSPGRPAADWEQETGFLREAASPFAVAAAQKDYRHLLPLQTALVLATAAATPTDNRRLFRPGLQTGAATKVAFLRNRRLENRTNRTKNSEVLTCMRVAAIPAEANRRRRRRRLAIYRRSKRRDRVESAERIDSAARA